MGVHKHGYGLPLLQQPMCHLPHPSSHLQTPLAHLQPRRRRRRPLRVLRGHDPLIQTPTSVLCHTGPLIGPLNKVPSSQILRNGQVTFHSFTPHVHYQPLQLCPKSLWSMSRMCPSDLFVLGSTDLRLSTKRYYFQEKVMVLCRFFES